MVTFRNNNRRSNFRRNDRNYKRNGEISNFKSHFSSNDNFQRKVPSRNNHNALQLMEKYSDLAREALTNEDKILSENYFQHADHFKRILKEQEKNRIDKKADVSVKEVDNNKKTSAEVTDKKEPEKQIAQ